MESKIECRPLICGSMGLQPFYKNQFGELNLPNVSLIDEQGMYIPNNPDLSQGELGFMVEKINSAIRI
jgi:CDP-6-deoxy-D-xylo-4-hexulose-3-dehydrase